jgi:hypothetical protein
VHCESTTYKTGAGRTQGPRESFPAITEPVPHESTIGMKKFAKKKKEFPFPNPTPAIITRE